MKRFTIPVPAPLATFQFDLGGSANQAGLCLRMQRDAGAQSVLGAEGAA